MIEKMICDGETRIAYEKSDSEFSNLLAVIENTFGEQQTNLWLSISNPHYNPVFDDSTIAVKFHTKPAYAVSLENEPQHVGRKFALNKQWVYDKFYYITSRELCELPYPNSAYPLAIGIYENIYGQPGDSDLSAYKCLYFSCNDHNEVENWCGETLPQGEISTYYAATFLNNECIRVKTYCYDDENELLSAWEVIWLQHAKKLGMSTEM